MRPRLTYALSALLLTGAFLSCRKDHPSSGPVIAPPGTVYVLGVQNGSVVYWKNGTINPVYSENSVLYNFGTSSLAASGNNVYIAGFEQASDTLLFPYTPVFWLNGSAMTLPDSTGTVGNGTANSIAVSGQDVYVAGIRGYDSQRDRVPFSGDSSDYPITGSVATLWKNGTPVTLPDYGAVGLVDSEKYANRFYDDYVSALCVAGSDVYVAGGTAYNIAAHARYWKNGAPVDLGGSLIYSSQNGTNGFPTSTGIYVSGSDIYVSGYQQTAGTSPVAIYWKNGTPVFLSTDSLSGSEAYSIFVAGSDVYVAGWQNINNYSRAMLWKNGTPTPLTSNNVSSAATSMFVYGNDIYVAGYTWVAPTGNYVAAYWKNGSLVQLSDGSSNASAYSIFVVI
jgi:hypothetical protein